MKVLMGIAAFWLIVVILASMAPKPINHVEGAQGFGEPASLSEVAPGACDLWMGSKHGEGSAPISAIKTSQAGDLSSYEVTCLDGTVSEWPGK